MTASYKRCAGPVTVFLPTIDARSEPLNRPWLSEFFRISVMLVLALLLGWYLDSFGLGLVLGLVAYIVRHLYHLYRLSRWLHQRKRLPVPRAHGLWGDVFRHMGRLQQRNRKRKRKLHQYLKSFQDSTEAMPDATVVLDAEGTIAWFNRSAQALLGLRQPQDIGQRFCNLIRHPDVIGYLRDGGEEEVVEFTSPIDSDLRLSLRAVRYGKNQRLVIARDVTRLHRLEQIRRDFVANVSHELKTPLTVITGYLETMADAAGDYPQHWRRSLQSMQSQAERMGRLLEDLLLLSRLETTEVGDKNQEPVAVPALLAAIEEDARLVSGDGLTIAAEVDGSLWLIGDAHELRSAFTNLVQNAVRYTGPGGRVTLRWRGEGDGARFEVEDTGIGIPPQHLPRLTERFYRVDVGRSRQGGGTGLGLAIVKHVLNRHEAHLTIASEPGEGSVFSCLFPQARVLRRDRPAPVRGEGSAPLVAVK